MKNKKWLLLLIIAFPSLFWLILETSTIHSRKLPYYGPKTTVTKGDTSYYQVTDLLYAGNKHDSSKIEPLAIGAGEYPLYAVIFISKKYRDDAYRLTGLWEYLNYKKQKIEHIPFILVTPFENGQSEVYNELKKLSNSPNVHFYNWHATTFDSITKVYFKEKPYYIDYSFFMLIDQDRHIRGYYDGRYVSEIKRLIEEYQHLRLKEEKQKLIQTNEIKSDV